MEQNNTDQRKNSACIYFSRAKYQVPSEYIGTHRCLSVDCSILSRLVYRFKLLLKKYKKRLNQITLNCSMYPIPRIDRFYA